MFKKIPIWNFTTGANEDVWFNPAQIETGKIQNINAVAFVLIQTNVNKYYYKGTPAQLNALLI